MNNDQFRRLLASNSQKTNENDTSIAKPGPSPQSKAALGSRHHSSMPMAPRAIKKSAGTDFIRQAASNRPSQKSSRQFKSVAPKGSHLAQGYHDRTQDRIDDDADDAGRRIKALEESLRLDEIDEETFERLRNEITGGNVEKTYLVKGLDRQLLERIKRGENVQDAKADAGSSAEQVTGDIDDEFETLEKQDITAVQKQKSQKKGQMASPAVLAGSKRTRNQILAELKASRKRAAELKHADQPNLGAKFRKIGESQETSRLEVDEKGREVLILTDANGNIKRKVKKSHSSDNQQNLPNPNRNANVLGADVVIPEQRPQEESDEDIFAGVGDDYDPLGEDDDDSDSAVEAPPQNPVNAHGSPVGDESSQHGSGSESESRDVPQQDLMPKPSKLPPRNYFNDDTNSLSVLGNISNPLKDPAFLAALAQKTKVTSEDRATNSPPAEAEVRLKRRAEILGAQDRDLEDLDMGFGSSRFDDAEDMVMDGSKLTLSEWKGGHNDDEDETDKRARGSNKRKRGLKRRKGDKDSVTDVLQAMERRKT